MSDNLTSKLIDEINERFTPGKIDTMNLSEADIQGARELLEESDIDTDNLPDEVIEAISRAAAKSWIQMFRIALSENREKLAESMDKMIKEQAIKGPENK